MVIISLLLTHGTQRQNLKIDIRTTRGLAKFGLTELFFELNFFSLAFAPA